MASGNHPVAGGFPRDLSLRDADVSDEDAVSHLLFNFLNIHVCVCLYVFNDFFILRCSG